MRLAAAIELARVGRLFEAETALRSLGAGEAADQVAGERQLLELEMKRVESTKRSQEVVVRPRKLLRGLTQGIEIRRLAHQDTEDGQQLGLYATRSFGEGEILFRESPLAVAALGPDQPPACRTCLRPLMDRRAVVERDGQMQDSPFLLGADAVEDMFQQCGLERLQPEDGTCSLECRRDPLPVRRQGSSDDTGWLASLLVHSHVHDTALTYLYASPCPGEPDHLRGSDLELWRVVRRNAIEATTHPMAMLVDPLQGGLTPIVDEGVSCHGSALFLICSFMNHHCTDANVAPVFLDTLKHTPFVATRDIVVGEELFLDYAASVDDPRDKRIRNYLAHGFVCKC